MVWLLNGIFVLALPSALVVEADEFWAAQATGQGQPEKQKERDPINPDRPGIADGSMVVGKGIFQIELGLQLENHDPAGGGHVRLLDTPVLFRYGLDSRFELRVESVGFNEQWQTGARTAAGYAPVSVGAKFQFQQPSDKNGQVSLGTITRVFAPSGAGGFQTQHATGDLRLAADWTMAPHWYLNPNLGLGLYEDNGRPFTALLGAMTLSRDLNSRTQVFIDSGTQTPESRGGHNGTIVDMGITFLPTNDTQLDFSVGTGVSGQTTPRPFVGAGYSIRF